MSSLVLVDIPKHIYFLWEGHHGDLLATSTLFEERGAEGNLTV